MTYFNKREAALFFNESWNYKHIDTSSIHIFLQNFYESTFFH